MHEAPDILFFETEKDAATLHADQFSYRTIAKPSEGHFESFESDVSGSGKVALAATIDGTADFGISGSGKIQASGTADQVKATISGSGRVLAADLQTNRCDVRISGSGDVEINVTNELDANISGSGSVSYRGNPKKINSHSAGSGKVRKI